ncbi:DnaA regulatory inactivator Hda [Salinisphaera orenii]|uniref:DnaA regulatory inactivator Hda n=1 Tax=Salinisphaera orenii YIM 95161 TaxID=1051139 RepID=A0A423Q8R5_9GAMM|nr:DnaA regulatory inactivator Hda [Salinisphaera halophila]ROO36749.1 DnaA regulatory inactivator Hda [Salinisphaera halophila YIM 95161]
MATQLVLGVQLPQSATLDAFVGGRNSAAKAAVADLAAGRSERLFIHGPEATGKTHLLQAVCRAVGDGGARSVYVPLAQLGRDAESLLAGLDDMDCVCVDDVSAIAAHRDAEIALLSLTEGLRHRGGRLLAADARPPADIGLALPDLASRLGWGGVVAMATPDDADKQAMLVRRAAQRGMDLPEATARWLLRHGTRDVPWLMDALERLDEASLAEQRRLTIPFVKQALRVEI